MPSRNAGGFGSCALGWALCVVAALGVAEEARGHTIRPQEVVAYLSAPAQHEAFSIVDVSPSPSLPRLLVIKVSTAWQALDADKRRDAAEGWRNLWRSSIADGIVAVVDAETGSSLVSFDVNGRAQLKSPP